MNGLYRLTSPLNKKMHRINSIVKVSAYSDNYTIIVGVETSSKAWNWLISSYSIKYTYSVNSSGIWNGSDSYSIYGSVRTKKYMI